MPERFSASNAGKHMACHASANLELAIPNWVAPVEDPAADNAANKGTNAHKILAEIAQLPASQVEAYVKALAYYHEVRKQRRFTVLVEVEAEAAWLDVPTKTTVDVALHTQDQLDIVDWKWGKIPVEVEENDQLLFYAATFAPLAPKAKGVTVHIVQPFADNMASWYIDTNRLGQFMDEARAAQKQILNGSTTFTPGDHCTFCPANPHTRGLKGKPLCPAMMQLLYPHPFDEDEILSL